MDGVGGGGGGATEVEVHGDHLLSLVVVDTIGVFVVEVVSFGVVTAVVPQVPHLVDSCTDVVEVVSFGVVTTVVPHVPHLVVSCTGVVEVMVGGFEVVLGVVTTGADHTLQEVAGVVLVNGRGVGVVTGVEAPHVPQLPPPLPWLLLSPLPLPHEPQPLPPLPPLPWSP